MVELTNREFKLWSMLGELNGYYCEKETEETEQLRLKGLTSIRISRYELRQKIMSRLNIHDVHTINNYILMLLSQHYLIQNPTTHLTNSGIIKPTNNTMYFIDIDVVRCTSDKLTKKLESHTHTSLDKFT